MFILESTFDGAPPVIEEAIMTDSEAGTYGELVVFSSGRLTKCATTGTPDGVLVESTTAGTDVNTKFVRIRRDQVFLADYTGTAPTVGVKTYQLDSTGLLVNGAQASSGKIIIKSVDTGNEKARVIFDV